MKFLHRFSHDSEIMFHTSSFTSSVSIFITSARSCLLRSAKTAASSCSSEVIAPLNCRKGAANDTAAANSPCTSGSGPSCPSSSRHSVQRAPPKLHEEGAPLTVWQRRREGSAGSSSSNSSSSVSPSALSDAGAWCGPVLTGCPLLTRLSLAHAHRQRHPFYKGQGQKWCGTSTTNNATQTHDPHWCRCQMPSWAPLHPLNGHSLQPHWTEL